MIFLLLFTGFAYADRCEPGWSFFKNNCYKHIISWNGPNSRVTYGEAYSQCEARNSYLTSVESPEERDFIQQLSLRRGGWDVNVDALTAFPVAANLRVSSVFNDGVVHYGDMVLVGAVRDKTTGQFKWPNSTSTWINWCKDEPSSKVGEDCTIMEPDQSCIHDFYCDGDRRPPTAKFARFVCKKAAPCTDGAEVKSNGRCGCKKEFFDITDTDVPERRDYEKGEMCISRIPCQNVTSKDTLSIVFVVDSSQSIGAKNWKNMVKFLKNGAYQLDNSINVGFVKFSTEVTSSNWLPKRWTKDDYLDQTPTTFDEGYTNTPAALDEAGRLFASDRSTHKVAVLITDGMPYVEDILPKEEAMPRTTDAANRLTKAGIDLVALGYGRELVKYSSYLKQVLANPRTDYFEYDKEAGDLKDIHMTVLLNKVCVRYQ